MSSPSVGSNGVVFAVCLVIVAIVFSSSLDLPFYGDSVGYGIVNTLHMVENRSLMPPEGHDPGHGPAYFWSLAVMWLLFGRDVAITHWHSFLWMAYLLAGTFRLGEALSGSAWRGGLFAAGLVLCHGFFFSMAIQSLPDLPLTAFSAWMFYAFYAKRIRLFAVHVGLLLLTKVQAVPAIFFFGIAEFVVVGGILWL